MIGASGAIAGVLGAYLVLFPRARILSLVPILFIFTLIEIPAPIFLLFWFGSQLFSGFLSLSGASGSGIAWWAHIGGFMFGLLSALFVCKTKQGSLQIIIVCTKISGLHPAKGGRINNKGIKMSKNYLITGGAGFIGSNYVHRLLARGEKVTIYDNLSRAGASKNRDWLEDSFGKDSIRLVVGDVRTRSLDRSGQRCGHHRPFGGAGRSDDIRHKSQRRFRSQRIGDVQHARSRARSRGVTRSSFTHPPTKCTAAWTMWR